MILKKYNTFYLLSFFFVCGCSVLQSQSSERAIISNIKQKNNRLTAKEWKNWQHKDIFIDTIAGISLDKAYDELLKNKKANTITVAVLDMRIHKNHEDIKEFIWENSNEIPNNGIDDDDNGYIDDINGWNFLGNASGQQAYRANFEYVRIIRKYQDMFGNKKDIKPANLDEYNIYSRARKVYENELKYVKGKLMYYDSIEKDQKRLESDLSKLFPNKSLTIKELKTFEAKDSIVLKKIELLKKYVVNFKKNKSRRAVEQRYVDIYLNSDYNERVIIGDDISNIHDIVYGNNIIESDTTANTHTHAIKVAGLIAANRNNNKGIKGVINNVKIMPISISPYGDEQDKDVALGIRYAVNNGAKVINISSSKEFSLNQEWVLDAMLYAKSKNVLIVTSAGNESKNLNNAFNYPNDTNKKNKEVLNNFIKVGASGYSLDESLVHYTSNYGKRDVDIFAPGRYIFTTHANNSYNFSSGTSLATPLVSGIASLIFSYYPNLTAAEVKQIIMESGISLDIMANKPSRSKEKELVPFSSLSKSGKIVNAYNALLMAEEVSKKKKQN